MSQKRLFISADMEGIAGVVSLEQLTPKGFEYQQACQWMTNEVSAACEAAFEQGFAEIVVADSHANAQNLLLDELPDNVQVIRSWPRKLGMMEGIQRGPFDAAMLIGYHNGAYSADGMLAHTLMGSMFKDVRINGQSASETLLSAATAGHFGVPIVLVSGDDCYVKHALELLGEITTVTTKFAAGYLSAQNILPRQVCQLMKENAGKALSETGSYQLYSIEGPLMLEIVLKSSFVAEVLNYLKEVERVDAYTIQFNAEDMVEVCEFITFLLHTVSGIK